MLFDQINYLTLPTMIMAMSNVPPRPTAAGSETGETLHATSLPHRPLWQRGQGERVSNQGAFACAPLQQITLPTTPTTTIAYRVLGNGEGPVVLLLHGWGSSSRYWQGTMQALAQGYTVYAPDLPGYGKSPPCDIPASPDSMAQLVMAFADALGLEQFHLNGHSFSAAVAAHIAVGWAERVQSLTMTCPCTYHNDLERQIVRVIHHMTAVWMAMRRSWMVGKVPLYRFVSRSFFYRTPKDADILRAIFDDFFCMDERTALESAINAANPGYNDVLRQIATPTLIIGCRQDRVMPLYGPPLVANRISTGRIVWIERCGHLPMMERPAIYHRILQEFLTNDQQQYFSLS